LWQIIVKFHLPWWLHLHWPDYLIIFGSILFYIALLAPLPATNEYQLVPSLIAQFLIGGIKIAGIYLGMFLMVTGFIATAWKVGRDIYKNKTPVIIYFIIEIFICYVYI